METDLNRVAEMAIGALKKNGADKAHVEAGSREVHEINVESGKLSLLRTTFDQSLAMRAVVQQRQAVLAGNQFSDAEILQLAQQTAESARASAPDPAFDISPLQPAKKFRSGPEAGDSDDMVAKADEFLEQVRRRFPNIIMEQMIVKFAKRRRTVANSNGVHFETAQNDYEASFMFTAKSGRRQSGINYSGAAAADLNQPLMMWAGVDELMAQSTQLMDAKPMQGKFVGDLVVTPHCLPNFIGGLTGYLSAGSLLTGQSVYDGKLGERIADESFTLRAVPQAPDFALPQFVTSDGYLSENIDIVRAGVLKTYLLDQYGAAKLKKSRAGSDNDYHVVEPGSASLAEIIKGVDRGLLLGGFSGGYPASNGDLTGVAKNSFLIEKGEIRGPVTECMIAGNIPKMLLSIQGISRETINFGTAKFPWVRIRGVTVSGGR